MSRTNLAPATLVDVIWPAAGLPRALKLALCALVGTAILTLSAKTQVPFYPVPMTLQTLATVLIGMAFGWRLAAVTLLLYLVEGAAGLPVFAGTPEKGIGLNYMMGPTGGYLLGFLFGATAAGWLAERRQDLAGLGLAVLAGMVLIYIPGIVYLGALAGFDQALAFGLYPFLPAEALKSLLALLVAMAGAAALRRRVAGLS